MKNCSRFQNKILAPLSIAGLLFTVGCAKVEFTPVPVDGSFASETPVNYNPKVVKTTEVVAYGNKQVDFLLVLDDSNSMLPELRKLAARMEAFVSSLDDSQIEWQMCLTTTRGTSAVDNPGLVQYGALLNWSNYNPAQGKSSRVLARGTNNLSQIFSSTIEAMSIGGGLSGDERGIKATHNNFSNPASDECYRPGAAVSVILISDEDVRSVGGNPSKVKPNDAVGALKPLETDDLPSELISQTQKRFGKDVRFTFSSIIVKPGDVTCEQAQDTETSPSHPGYVYEEIASLTDGGVGSICDDDYSSNLNSFKNKIVNSLSALNLECVPVLNTLKIKIGGMNVFSYRVDGRILKFEYPLVEGTHVDLEYQCVSEKK